MSVLNTCLALPVLLALVSCKTLPREPVEPPNYPPSSCASACSNATRLCGPGTLQPSNGTCADVCQATEAGGGDFRTGCLSAAQTCPQVNLCAQ